jgi:hypothetical protein
VEEWREVRERRKRGHEYQNSAIVFVMIVVNTIHTFVLLRDGYVGGPVLYMYDQARMLKK